MVSLADFEPLRLLMMDSFELQHAMPAIVCRRLCLESSVDPSCGENHLRMDCRVSRRPLSRSALGLWLAGWSVGLGRHSTAARCARRV